MRSIQTPPDQARSLATPLGLVRIILLSTLAFMSSVASANVIITYKDVGANLQFDYSGSLGFSATGLSTYDYGVVGIQSTYNPIFYNNPDLYGGISGVQLISHTAGHWGTNLPSATSNYTNSVAQSGDSLMFRMNFYDSLPVADSIDIWGNWGAANTYFAGSLTVAGSSASFGMVDDYTIVTSGGSITFKAASVPAPATVLLLALGVLVMRKRFA